MVDPHQIQAVRLKVVERLDQITWFHPVTVGRVQSIHDRTDGMHFLSLSAKQATTLERKTSVKVFLDFDPLALAKV